MPENSFKLINIKLKLVYLKTFFLHKDFFCFCFVLWRRDLANYFRFHHNHYVSCLSICWIWKHKKKKEKSSLECVLSLNIQTQFTCCIFLSSTCRQLASKLRIHVPQLLFEVSLKFLETKKKEVSFPGQSRSRKFIFKNNFLPK